MDEQFELLRDLQRRLANVVRRGVIDDVIPGSPTRVKVNIGRITTPPLPWCQGRTSSGVQTRDLPAIGDAVTILSEAGDLRNGRVYPGTNIDAIPVPEGSASEHVTRYDDGTEVRYDRQAHTLTITLAEGGHYTLKGKGTLDGDVDITGNLSVMLAVSAKTVSDEAGAMSAMRDTYDHHDHNENGDGGGVTDAPNQPMSCGDEGA